MIDFLQGLGINVSEDFGVHGFGVLVAIGFWFGTIWATRKCKRDGLDPEVVNKLVVWIIGAVFIGGHLGHLLFYEPELLRQDPRELLYIWHGLSSTGGFITAAVVVYLFFRYHKVSVWAYGDAILFGLAIGWTFGRLGCFIAHDHPGIVSDSLFAVKSADPAILTIKGQTMVRSMCPVEDAGKACLDMGLIEAVWSACLAALFWGLDRKGRFPGLYVGLFAALYGPFRFVADFYRHPSLGEGHHEELLGFALTPAQIFSAVVFVLGVWLLVRNRKLSPQRDAIRGPVAPEPAAS